MIKKIPYKHRCASTSQLENNCMATNSWVRDRVINKLREDPTIGAAALKKSLEEKYCIKLSYYVVWDGRQMALDEILGGWEDSFQAAYSFKAELEKRSPGSIVEVSFDLINGKHRFSKMFVALKPCVDGFLNGCRPYLGVDSTVLTGKWRGQLASAVGIDGHNWMFPVAYGVYDPDAPPPAPPKPKRVRKKDKPLNVTATESSMSSAVGGIDSILGLEDRPGASSMELEDRPGASSMELVPVPQDTSPGPLTRRQKALLDAAAATTSPKKAKKKKNVAKKL